MNEFMPSDLKDYIYITFLLTTIILGLLTYINAKKSILQPIRTEIIKSQIQLFSSIVKFIEKEKYYCGNNLALLNIIEYISLLDQHIKSVYKQNKDINDIINSRRGSIPCNLEGFQKNEIRSPNGFFIQPALQFYPDQRVAVHEIIYDINYKNFLDKITSYKENPFLPEIIIKKFDLILNLIRKDFTSILSKEIENQIHINIKNMKELKTDAEILSLTLLISIAAHNEFNHKRTKTKEIFEDINNDIRKILKIDKILIK